MTDLILDEIGMKNDSGQIGASLRRDAEILTESFSQGARRGEVVKIVPRPVTASVFDRGMRRFIWWCMGCPIRSKA